MSIKIISINEQSKQLKYNRDDNILRSTIVIGIGNCGRHILNDFHRIDPNLLTISIVSKPEHLDDNNATKVFLIEDPSSNGKLEVIENYLQCTDMVYIVSSSSDLYGSKIVPLVTKMIYNLGITTNVMLIRPFTFEGKDAMKFFINTSNEIAFHKICDTLYHVDNDSLITSANAQGNLKTSFKFLNKVLMNIIMGKISHCSISNKAESLTFPDMDADEDEQLKQRVAEEKKLQYIDDMEELILSGDTNAMVEFGKMLTQGSWLKKDIEFATELFSDASSLGNAEATWLLSRQYECGVGTDYDPDKALSLCEKAANLGSIEAMIHLVQYNGYGDKKYHDLSAQWYEDFKGIDRCRLFYRLGKAYKENNSENPDYGMSLLWLALATENGNNDAAMCLAEMYQTGHIVDKDLSMARYWYQKAVDNGYIRAKMRLDDIKDL